MILKSISLHNFMSYGDATLDMSPLSIACLCGHNGAGKSAILDAITWTLWESARSSSDELIRLGQPEMWVDLTFELEQNTYRIRRGRALSGPRQSARSTKGSLDFQVWNTEDKSGGKWVALTGASMRETQARICQTLRMDYDTFTNSVYLRQGRADEFTTRPPAERKQVLSEILGLNYFDNLAELARERVRALRAEIDYLQSVLQDDGGLQNDHANALKETQEFAAQIAADSTQILALSDTLARLQTQLIELADLRSRLEPTETRLQEITRDIELLEPAHKRLQARRQELIDLLAAAPAMHETFEQFNALKALVEKLDTIALERQTHESKRYELKSTLASRRGRLEVELEHQQAQLVVLQEQRQKFEKAVGDRERLQKDFGEYKKLLAHEAEMSRRQEAYTQLSVRAQQLNAIVIEARLRLEAELNLQNNSVAELLALLSSQEELRAQEHELQARSEALDLLEIEFESIEQSGLTIKQEIESYRQQINAFKKELDENGQKCHELTEAHKLTMCPLCAAPIVDRAAVVERYQRMNNDINQQILELESKVTVLEDKRQQLRTRYVELKRELDTRKKLDRQTGEHNAKMAALSRAEETLARARQTIADLERRLEVQDYAQIERESLINIKSEMHKLDFDPIIFSSLQAQLRMQRNVEIRYQQYKRDLSELERLNEQIPQLESTITDITEKLANDRFADEEQQELNRLDALLADIPYDRNEHDSARQQLAKLLPLVDKLRDFERLAEESPEIERQLHETSNQIETKKKQQDELQTSVATWSARLADAERLSEEKLLLEERLQTMQENRAANEKKLAVLETRLEQLESQKQSFEARQTKLNESLVSMNDHQFLAECFGKKGIQAIIIENAVPELEAEANNILARLTENQMHIGLVTQTKTKQGVAQETLDILIADQLGTRSYELYSGGEAFKINFAMRVALSRLLARRAGAKLQTLIIDEGFGSQDEQSRGRLMQAINAIKKDFSRIIVVTHIAEIKELFPTQIQVDKLSGVSRLTVVHS